MRGGEQLYGSPNTDWLQYQRSADQRSKKLRDTSCVDWDFRVWMFKKTCRCLTHNKLWVKWFYTVWHKMAPGLGERSTAYPGHLTWAALNKTIHVLRKKKDWTAAKSHHRNRIKQTNESIKKKSDHSCISLRQDLFFFLLFFPLPSFLEVVIYKSSPFDPHLATCAVALL